MNLEAIGFRVVKRKACVFVRHQAPQGFGNGIEQLMQVKHGHYGIVHFQKEAQAVTLDDAVQLGRKLLEERPQIAIRGDRFGNFQKRLVLVVQ